MKRKTDNFDKFYNRKRNSAVKEEVKQQKKKEKKEKRESYDRFYEQQRNQRAVNSSIAKPDSGEGNSNSANPVPSGDRKAKSEFGNFNYGKAANRKEEMHARQLKQGGESIQGKPPGGQTASKLQKGEKGSGEKKIIPTKNNRPTPVRNLPSKNPGPKKSWEKAFPSADRNSITKENTAHKSPVPAKSLPVKESVSETLPLNKYVAHAGVSSRRAAAQLVKEGKVTVNGTLVTDPGTKVLFSDTVKVSGKKLTISSHFVYILLNKPKDFLTTTSDPQGRKTVLQLISKATDERVYPIGRLDRNTSGVLLFTNDGDLSQKLSHPKNEVKKIYHVSLDKPLTKQHFEKIIGGLELEDGPVRVDEMAYADPKDKTQIGLEIHTGKNRIVRRIFASLGYDVKNLDRVMYAGLTKKNVPRGTWRFLTDREIRTLKYLKS